MAEFDTPTVCNVIELLEVLPRSWGFMDARIKSMFPDFPPIVGYASTATFRSALPAEKSDAYSNIIEQVKRFEIHDDWLLHDIRNDRGIKFKERLAEAQR